MLKIIDRADAGCVAEASVTLPFERRQKSRLRVCLDNGQAAALLLSRGTVLRDGDRLRAENGLVVVVRAAAEAVSTGYGRDPVQLARACYHLGNRHVALQIGDGWLRYLQDHVLDSLVSSLGLKVVHEALPFEAETGAYHGGGHSH